jgi:hypothetical protein
MLSAGLAKRKASRNPPADIAQQIVEDFESASNSAMES